MRDKYPQKFTTNLTNITINITNKQIDFTEAERIVAYLHTIYHDLISF